MACALVDSEASLEVFLDKLQNLPAHPPSLYLDLEGVNLSRHGTISILQVFFRPSSHTFLIDIHVLGRKAFDTLNGAGLTLHSILESDKIIKVLFDCRNDSDALYNLYGVFLQNVHDLQLFEVATRKPRGSYISGLAKCIQWDAGLSFEEMSAASTTKQKGKLLFAPELGGSYEVFTQRQMSKEIIEYCVQDVGYLPRLWDEYARRYMSVEWVEKVAEETSKRVAVCKIPGYDPKGRDKALSPWPCHFQCCI